MAQTAGPRPWNLNRLQALGVVCVLGAAGLAVSVALLGSPAEFGGTGIAIFRSDFFTSWSGAFPSCWRGIGAVWVLPWPIGAG